MIVNVRVTPRAKFNKIELPKIWITAAPADGAANMAVIKILAEHFGVAKSRVRMVRGETSRDKVFEIGID